MVASAAGSDDARHRLEPGRRPVAARHEVAVAARPEEPEPPFGPGRDAHVLDPVAARDDERPAADAQQVDGLERRVAGAVGDVDAAGADARGDRGALAGRHGGRAVRVRRARRRACVHRRARAVEISCVQSPRRLGADEYQATKIFPVDRVHRDVRLGGTAAGGLEASSRRPRRRGSGSCRARHRPARRRLSPSVAAAAPMPRRARAGQRRGHGRRHRPGSAGRGGGRRAGPTAPLVAAPAQTARSRAPTGGEVDVRVDRLPAAGDDVGRAARRAPARRDRLVQRARALRAVHLLPGDVQTPVGRASEAGLGVGRVPCVEARPRAGRAGRWPERARAAPARRGQGRAEHRAMLAAPSCSAARRGARCPRCASSPPARSRCSSRTSRARRAPGRARRRLRRPAGRAPAAAA